MARRPVFMPVLNGDILVKTSWVDFEWHPGLSLSQKRKSIASLHNNAIEYLPCRNILEVSSKSENALGANLSAFNLFFTTKGKGVDISVECAFQGSKVFENGGPYTDLYYKSSLEAKRDPRLKESGRLLRFSFFSQDWPTEPLTAFYDWLYVNALTSRDDLRAAVSSYDAFTDIEFNPEKSINCQAYSAALYVSLFNRKLLNSAISDKGAFLDLVKKYTTDNARIEGAKQKALPF